MNRLAMLLAAVVAVTLIGSVALGQDNEAKNPAERIASAPANVAVKVLEEPTGGRMGPAFFWSPKAERFVLLGGGQEVRKGGPAAHYDVEYFDPATGQWTNAYPAGAPYKVVSGPSDAPAHPRPYRKPMLLTDANGVTRLTRLSPADSSLHHQWAYDAQSGRAYLHYERQTFIVTVPGSVVAFAEAGIPSVTMSDLDTFVWGSFCYDPVNKRILSIGGTSFEQGGTPGTCLLDADGKAWRRVALADKTLAGLQQRIESLRVESYTLLSCARSRFFVTESPEEAKVKLSEMGRRLQALLADLAKDVAAAKLGANMQAGQVHAVARLADYARTLDAVVARLDGPIDAGLLGQFRDGFRVLESAQNDLRHEPAGRAHSPMAYDPATRSIVLFGGNGLDRTYADTWVYDCDSQLWQQRYPKVAPAPRSNHVLSYLPKAGRIALVGGMDYNNPNLAFEIWTYDVAANVWTNLQHVEGTGRRPNIHASSPNQYRDLRVVGSAGPGDVVVMVESNGGKRDTWVVRVDAGKPAAGAGEEHGVAPSTVNYAYGPADYEKAAVIDTEKMAKVLANPRANTLVQLPASPKPAPTRDYGTTRYDPLRKQLLWWGGGHVNYWGTEVSHYSLRSGNWTASEVSDRAMEPYGGFAVRTALTFQGRPQIPVHAYQCYDYDPPSGLLLVNTRGRTFVYDPRKRLWTWLDNRIGSRAVRATPQGAITCTGGDDGARFQRFSAAQMQWVDLPACRGAKVPVVGSGYGDYNGFTFDEKRNCLWVFHRNGLYRYDIATGDSEQVRPAIADDEVLGYLRDMLYIPEIDKIMFVNREARTGKHQTFWDPQNRQWLRAEIEMVDPDGKPFDKVLKLSTDAGLMRDPQTGLLFVNADRNRMFVLRIDPATLKFVNAADAPPAGK